MFNKMMIYNYIKKITKNDIYNYGINEGINLSNDEINVIFHYIKNKYKDILNNPEIVLGDAKNKLSYAAYQKLLELYNKYKNMLN